MPAPIPPGVADAHRQLLESFDLALEPRPFRNPNWKPSQRRNKNIKQILSEAMRREASLLNAQQSGDTNTNNPSNNQSGASTPNPTISGSSTPRLTNGGNDNSTARTKSDLSQTTHNLATMVMERNLLASVAQTASIVPGAETEQQPSVSNTTGPLATYTNIESAPSLHAGDKRHYCDITGLVATYTDPKTRLRYVNKEVFEIIRALPQGTAEKYLEARGAHVILK